VSILRQLTEKPWLTPYDLGARPAPEAALGMPKAKAGLWVFLSVVTVLFLLLIFAYAGRMTLEDWRPGPELDLLWFNTAALVASSLAMQWATVAARRGPIADAAPGLLTGGLLTLVFLAGQLVAWRQLASMGAFGVTLPSVAFFYLITGLHGLHITGGLVAWARTLGGLWGDEEVARVRQRLALCTTYWHFMLGVWLVLFGLLFAGNNMSAVLAFCGLK
jgi:cytochrome c oxidase subunit 3